MSDGTPSMRIERTFDAPIELVWEMWADPGHFAAWYGPDGATVSVATMDVRVGGSRLIGMAMETPGGPRRMWFAGEYREVVGNERLVYTEFVADESANALPPSAMGMPDDHPVTTEVVVELGDLGGRTRMVMTHIGVPEGSPGAVGWAMAFGKLDSYLATHNG
ncbi:MAG TPA: SRPBCC domain-containing protein [Acidimicrobiia bacterium]|nr:SRPBCC domain-containing protein [Acidimicrobiia bacterium]